MIASTTGGVGTAAHRMWIRLLSVVLLGLGLTACDDDIAAAPHAAAPELAATDLADQTVKLADYRHKVVLVTFWLNGCGPCLAEFPGLEAVYQRHRDQGFAVLAVNLGQDKATIEASRAKVPVTFPFLADPLGISAKRFGVTGAPTAFLIDANGIVQERFEGPVTPEDLDRKVEALL